MDDVSCTLSSGSILGVHFYLGTHSISPESYRPLKLVLTSSDEPTQSQSQSGNQLNSIFEVLPLSFLTLVNGLAGLEG